MGLREEQKNLTEWVEGKRRSQKKKKIPTVQHIHSILRFAFCILSYTCVQGFRGHGEEGFSTKPSN